MTMNEIRKMEAGSGDHGGESHDCMLAKDTKITMVFACICEQWQWLQFRSDWLYMVVTVNTAHNFFACHLLLVLFCSELSSPLLHTYTHITEPENGDFSECFDFH